jgi:hypothetical protein
MKRLMFTFLIAGLLTGPVRAADFATQMLAATYKLYNKNSTATGFFVTDPIPVRQERKGLVLVTAKHVFAKMTGTNAIVVLRQTQADGTYKRRDFTVAIRTSDGKPLWTTNTTEDVAVMNVKLPADANVTPLPFEALATEEILKEINLHVTSPLFVLGFPTRMEANGAGFPIARHASVASFPLTPVKPHKFFLADFTTFAGDSGGPVFVPDARRKEETETSPPLIVGMVLSQFRHDETIKMDYEERTIHHPLELSNILHAQFLRDTIALLPK